ncbi:sulfatase-like hydrolase/transferase [Devosia nitrariae]|uniref:Arylsulfatase n=1 Tax=Devosia nitrariae TaxID=2071872 RepID=A0ABQ5W912_9HYPH|nr:sulfatase-like hydrolase/transferase [Devosia nitrariae]GLQ56430.1 arylsulfatase [Devosia nitrariae]
MTEPRKNVLLVTVDEWPARLMGAAGHPVIETPTLDALARAGTRYVNAYSETPVCVPARRSLMTGTDPRTHGDRTAQGTLRMPDLPTLADTFRAAGYQATAIGKLHVYPQRDRIGFDDVILAEEGRQLDGCVDDYEAFLAERGHAGEQFLHGMGNNEYGWRPWHLPEELHPTNWIATSAARAIKRRDPTRPGFWYVSFTAPHPPLVPLQSYFDRYARRPVDEPVTGEWAENFEALPPALQSVRLYWPNLPREQMADMRRAYYALCTHIDHQLRLIIGTLREEGILNDTVILFTSDHGDMLGDHGLYAKRLMYEASANIPMILLGAASDADRVAPGAVDDRLCGLQDVMATLFDLCGIAAPPSSTGISMVGAERRDIFYVECSEGLEATRMVHDGRFKLIWYPVGDRFQLFDLDADPRETRDLADVPDHQDRLQALGRILAGKLYGSDLAYLANGKIVGTPAVEVTARPNRGLSGQRGLQYPPLPYRDPKVATRTL